MHSDLRSGNPMPQAHTRIIGGSDSIIFDTRELNLSTADVLSVCRLFNLGQLKSFEKEPNIVVSHSNFIIFVITSRGKYVIKLYPPGSKNIIGTEYLINRVLQSRHFSTPAMHLSASHQPGCRIKDYLAVCYDFAEGKPGYRVRLADQHIDHLCRTLFMFKNILSGNTHISRTLQRSGFTLQPRSIRTLIASLTNQTDHPVLKKALLEACRYLDHNKTLLHKRPVHSNLSLSNILFDHGRTVLLDLSHTRIDHAMEDLASLIFSCRIFSAPQTVIRRIIASYFAIHKIRQEQIRTLTALLTIRTVREYRKTELKSPSAITHGTDPALVKEYKKQIAAHKEELLRSLGYFALKDAL